MRRRRYASLADYLEKTGTSQVDFAGRMGVTQATVSRWVAGTLPVDPATLLRLSTEAQVPLERLVARAASSSAGQNGSAS